MLQLNLHCIVQTQPTAWIESTETEKGIAIKVGCHTWVVKINTQQTKYHVYNAIRSALPYIHFLFSFFFSLLHRCILSNFRESTNINVLNGLCCKTSIGTHISIGLLNSGSALGQQQRTTTVWQCYSTRQCFNFRRCISFTWREIVVNVENV